MKLRSLCYNLNTFTKMLSFIIGLIQFHFYQYFVIENVNILHELYSPYIFFPWCRNNSSFSPANYTCNKIIPHYLLITFDINGRF